MIQSRRYTIPADLEKKISEVLKSDFKISLHDHKVISSCILRLSDFYIENPTEHTPWHEEWCQIAYLSYYLPLNEVRARAVIEQIGNIDQLTKLHQINDNGHQQANLNEKQNPLKFLNQFQNIYDFGSGLGSMSYPIFNQNKAESQQPSANHRFFHIECAQAAIRLHQKISWHNHSSNEAHWQEKIFNPPSKSLLCMSYSLTELDTLPDWFFDFDGYILIEPATQENSRRLMTIKESLVEKGYFIWAPCTHQGKCPLLHQSKTDWCHDRVHFDQPDWFHIIEDDLPIKNKTLTCSYLVASKLESPLYKISNRATKSLTIDTTNEDQSLSLNTNTLKLARTVGDQVLEKGKTRQLVCHNEDRLFLTWMHKDYKNKKNIQEVPRGSLIKWPHEFTLKSNEVRVSSSIEEIFVDVPKVKST